MMNRYVPNSSAFKTQISFDKAALWQDLTPPIDEQCVPLSLSLSSHRPFHTIVSSL